MKKVSALVVLFWIGMAALPGCDSCVCPKDRYADVIGLTPSIVKVDAATSGPNYIRGGESIPWSDIAFFNLTYEIRTYSQRNQPDWGMAVYACDCNPPGWSGSSEKLTTLTVRTVFDFDNAHPAGSLLTDIAVLRNYNTGSINSSSIPLADFLAKGPVSYRDMLKFSQLSLTGKPTQKGPFALDITVTLDNGETYTTRTTPIQLF